MNDPNIPHPVEDCLQRAFVRMEDYVRREPAKAVAMAAGAGLLLKIVPAHVMARTLAGTASSLLPPALLGLGLVKLLELCEQQRTQNPAASEPR